MVKRQFGSILTRFGHGHTLSAAEHHVLSLLIDRLLSELNRVAELQFEAYNLVQREVDGRALNFYGHKPMFGVAPIVPLLPEGKLANFPLIAGTLKVPMAEKDVHCRLNVVGQRIFSLNFSQPIKHIRSTDGLSLVNIKESWRSNLSGGP